jgi:zinc protease
MPADLLDPSAIQTGRLANGTSWAIWPDRRDAVATLQIWVSVGSRDEVPGKTGLAHMLEHLMFRGSRSVPDGEFDQRMESLGAQINAATWLDFTYYTATAHAGALPEVLRLEADRFEHLLVTEPVFKTERDVVANERRHVVESDPEALLAERFYQRIFGESCYGWPTIGWANDIANYRGDDAMRFYAEGYAPSRLLVAVAGAVEVDELVPLLEATFGCIPGRETVRPERTTRLAASFSDSMKLAFAAPRMLIGWPTGGRASGDFATWCLLQELLDGGESALLPAELMIRDKLALDVSASLYEHALPAVFELAVTLRTGVTAAQARDAIGRVLRRLADQGPDRDELDAARTRLRTRDAVSLSGTYARAEQLGESWIVFGDAKTGLDLPRRIAAVDAAMVRDLARRIVEESPRYELIGLPLDEAAE